MPASSRLTSTSRTFSISARLCASSAHTTIKITGGNYLREGQRS